MKIINIFIFITILFISCRKEEPIKGPCDYVEPVTTPLICNMQYYMDTFPAALNCNKISKESTPYYVFASRGVVFKIDKQTRYFEKINSPTWSNCKQMYAFSRFNEDGIISWALWGGNDNNYHIVSIDNDGIATNRVTMSELTLNILATNDYGCITATNIPNMKGTLNIIKYDINGGVIWETSYSNSASNNFSIMPECITEQPSGDFIIGGYYTGFPQDDSAKYIKISKTGVPLNYKTYQFLGKIKKVIGTNSGVMYLGVNKDQDYPSLMKVDSNGNILWDYKINGSLNEVKLINNFIYLLYSNGNLFFEKLDSNMNVIFKSQYGGTAYENGYTFYPQNSDFFVTGSVSFSKGLMCLNRTVGFIMRVDSLGQTCK